MEVSQTGLMDFESVRRDLDYELFSIRNEQGDPFFNADLLRNIKLVCYEAGKDISFEEDPLLRVRAVEDRDLQSTSSQILLFCHAAIEDFYKMFRQIKDMSIAQSLSQAIMGLHLAANPRNLIQNSSGKSSLQYFHDFLIYLRQAMNSSEYQKYVAYPPEAKEKVPHFLMHLCHSLSFALFNRLGGVKQETIGLIHRCMRKGEEKEKKKHIKGDTIWNQLLIDDEKFRTLLSQFPNGPLFKILDQIREEDIERMSFDPFLQENLPQRLCEIVVPGQAIEVFRTACPIRQVYINKVTVAEEFRGFLRFYAKNRKKHLFVNLQGQSWQECARSRCMETLQKNAEFNEQLIVATIPKSGDFYYQNGEFMNRNAADEFIAEFKKVLSQPEEWGFFIPPRLSTQELKKFTDDAISFIHQDFFNNQKNLSRRNREDFIEIFYQLLILKWIETIKPDSISLTCKDSVDIGAAALTMFYGFLRILKGGVSQETDFLRYLLYAPALFVRERAIDPERLTRALAALERIDSATEENGGVVKHMSDLYDIKFFKALNIKHL